MKKAYDIMLKKGLSNKLFKYLTAGIGTTLVNLLFYFILLYMGMKYYWANLIAIVIAKIFAFFANKIYVFQSYTKEISSLILEIIRYIFSRSLTGIIDYFLLILLVEKFYFSDVYSKYIVTFIVIVLNYVLSNSFVFKENENVQKN